MPLLPAQRQALFHLQVAKARGKKGLTIRQMADRLVSSRQFAREALTSLTRTNHADRFWAKANHWETARGRHVYFALDAAPPPR